MVSGSTGACVGDCNDDGDVTIDEIIGGAYVIEQAMDDDVVTFTY